MARSTAGPGAGPRLCAVLLAGVAAACAGSDAATDRALDADRLEVYRGDFTTRMLLTGELSTEDAELLVVPNANIWPVQIRWIVEDGIEVRRGDKVVEFDNSQLVTRLEDLGGQALAAADRLASLEAEADAARAAAAFALEERRAELEKAKLLADVPAGIYAERTYRKRHLALRRAELELAQAGEQLRATRQAQRAEIEIQRIALATAQAEVTRFESKIRLLTLEASRDGIVILENERREGRPLATGDAVYPGNVVARLPDLSTLIVAARLFDVDDGRIAPGMPVTATLDAFPDRVFTGRVRDIDPIADQPSARSLRRFFRTTIDLDEVDVERMRPGMSVKVVIEESLSGVLLAPRRGLEWTADGPRARLADGSYQALRLGACNATDCVVEAGLAESTRLAEAPG